MIVATWNINSVRLRINTILKFVKTYNIDVLCLQETKTEDKYFPLKEFKRLGLKFYNIRGEKSYNGVAILSTTKFQKEKDIDWCGLNDSRYVSIRFPNNIILHNFYVPAGGDIANVNTNPKFRHKIKFLKEMIEFFKNSKDKNILVGDLNIAPHENDVWSHKQLLNVVSHTSQETTAFQKLLEQGRLVDVIRNNSNAHKKIYSWWSYRSKNWKISDRGRRLDHVLVSKSIKDNVSGQLICKEFRDYDQPSDHVPIIFEI